MDFTYALMTRVTFAFMELIESRFVDTMLYTVGRYVLFYHYEAGSRFWHWLFDNGGASLFNFQYAIHLSHLKASGVTAAAPTYQKRPRWFPRSCRRRA